MLHCDVESRFCFLCAERHQRKHRSWTTGGKSILSQKYLQSFRAVPDTLRYQQFYIDTQISAQKQIHPIFWSNRSIGSGSLVLAIS